MSNNKTIKAALVEKIAKEQGLDPVKLKYMNIDQLQKMDKVVPDKTEDDLLGGDAQESPSTESQTQPGSQYELPSDVGGQSVSSENGSDIVTPSESPSKEPEISAETTGDDVPASDNSDGQHSRFLIGNHPMTGKPVYSDEQ